MSGHDWSNMPRVVFSDIMMKVGLERLEDLIRSRQVCKSWNEMIIGMTKQQDHLLRSKAASRLMAEWRNDEEQCVIPSREEVAVAKSLGK